MKNLFRFIAVSSFLLFSAIAFGQKKGNAQKGKPNVVFIYADDLGYGDISCYGATAIATPNIDELAARGIRFINAHSSSATCTPSR